MKLKISDINFKLISKVNMDYLRECMSIPIKEKDNKILVATVVIKEEVTDLFKFLFKKDVEYIIIEEAHLNELLEYCYKCNSEKHILKSGSDDTYKDLVDEIISKAVSVGASDIHFEIKSFEGIVRFRVDGSLQVHTKISKNIYSNVISVIKLHSSMDITERRRPQDGKILFPYGKKNIDIRVSTIPTVHGEKIVLRILDYKQSDLDLLSLNFSEKKLRNLNSLIDLHHGIVFVCGPTGSGKSTTLYAILRKINSQEINITTIEDPVEVYIDGINQISVDIKAGLNFASGLRSILRQDPDCVMIGETRDEETAKIAIRAAITGHKVYSTIHTNYPIEVFSRLEDMGVDKYLLYDAIKGIVAQRLIRKLCQCKEEYLASEEEIKIESSFKGKKFYRAKGCEKCGGTGLKGRLLISEILIIDDKLKEDLRRGELKKYLQSSKEYRKNQAQEYLYKGMISVDEYKRFIRGEALWN